MLGGFRALSTILLHSSGVPGSLPELALCSASLCSRYILVWLLPLIPAAANSSGRTTEKRAGAWFGLGLVGLEGFILFWSQRREMFSK